MDRLAPYREQLDELERRGRLRRLTAPAGRDFSSNDYLGLARGSFLRDAARAALDDGAAPGSGGSRLLSGNRDAHERLEAFAAAHYRAPAALFFGSGYGANEALFATLPQTGDLVAYDALSHASAHDGFHQGRASTEPFAHNDADACDDLIARWRISGGTGTPWIAVESLTSMDGDRANLADFAAVAARHDAFLVVDEAHATGVFGARGEGLLGALAVTDLPDERRIVMRTCGKALGVSGALVTLPTVMRDFLVNRARGFIFSTAPPPLVADLVRRAIAYVANAPDLRQRLHERIACADRLLGDLCPAASAGSQIKPVIIGDDAAAVAVAETVQREGFDVRAIRPPTVPAGTARLRVSITLNTGEDDLDALADAIRRALAGSANRTRAA